MWKEIFGKLCGSVLENLFQKILYVIWKVYSEIPIPKSLFWMHFIRFGNFVSRIVSDNLVSKISFQKTCFGTFPKHIIQK